MQRFIGELTDSPEESGSGKDRKVAEVPDEPADESSSRPWSAVVESELLLPERRRLDDIEEAEAVDVAHVDNAWNVQRSIQLRREANDDEDDDSAEIHNRVGVMANHLQIGSHL